MIDFNQSAHSHDSVELLQEGIILCVRKTFRSDLERSARSVAKQQGFIPLSSGVECISAAEVLSFSVKDDYAELLMPYIEGITGPLFAVYASKNIAHSLGSLLSALLYEQLNKSEEKSVPASLFRAKLDSVILATSEETLVEILMRTRSSLDTLPESIVIPIGPCHGDLTLSNIIYKPSHGIILIDFLDTFLETPLQDVAKLKQDFCYGWSFRSAQSAVRIKGEILCRHHLPEAIIDIERLYPRQVRLLTLMVLARIAPYVQDEVTRQWLYTTLSDCLGDDWQ